MSAGTEIEKAHKATARACGLLVTLIVKKRISREFLEGALELLEEAVATIKGVLTAYPGGSKVGVLTPESSGEDNGTTDARG